MSALCHVAMYMSRLTDTSCEALHKIKVSNISQVIALAYLSYPEIVDRDDDALKTVAGVVHSVQEILIANNARENTLVVTLIDISLVCFHSS